MKYLLSTIGIVAVIVGALALATPARAATTAFLTPVNIRTTAGKSFDVTITVDPEGATDYTEKMEIDFPASLLKETSFSIDKNWIALPQPGYDSINSASGVLVKTAGYPGGISGPVRFGVITFQAKKSGTGTIMIGNSSLAFQVNSQSPVTGSGSNLSVAAAPTVSAPNEEVTEPVVETVPVTPEATVTPVQIPATSTQVAAVGATGTSYTWLWILIAVLIIIVIVWWIFMSSKPE